MATYSVDYEPSSFSVSYILSRNSLYVCWDFDTAITTTYTYITVKRSNNKQDWFTYDIELTGNGPYDSFTKDELFCLVPLPYDATDYYKYYKVYMVNQSYTLDQSPEAETSLYANAESDIVEVPVYTFDIDGILDVTARDNTKDTFNLDFQWTRSSSNPPLESLDVYLSVSNNPDNFNGDEYYFANSIAIHSFSCSKLGYTDMTNYIYTFNSESFTDLITNVNYGDYVQLIMKPIGQLDDGMVVIGTAKSPIIRRYKGLPTKIFKDGRWYDTDTRIYTNEGWKFIGDAKQYLP